MAVHFPDIVLCEPSCPDVMKEDEMITEAVVTDASAAIVPPPPGFPSLNTVVEEVPG